MIRIPCPGCSGHGRYTIGRGPVAPLYICDECNGDGMARCEARRCTNVAADAVVVGTCAVPLCTEHMQQYQEEEIDDHA